MNSYYQKQVAQAQTQVSKINRRINTYALTRLVVLLGGAAVLFQVVQTENVWLVLLCFFVFLFAFLALVSQQSKWSTRKKIWSSFEEVNQNELQISAGHKNIYDDGAIFQDSTHPFSDDLDVFGNDSLFSLINRASTPLGKQYLATWLSQAMLYDDITARQEAVQELGQEVAWCQDYQVSLFPLKDQKTDLKKLLQHYVNQDSLALGGKWLRRYVQVAPFLVVLTFILSLFTSAAWGSITISLLLVHLSLSFFGSQKVSLISLKIDKAYQALGALGISIAAIEKKDWQSILLDRLRKGLRNEAGQTSSEAIKNLARIIQNLDVRLNMLLGTILNAVFLWDFRQVYALQQWHENDGQTVLGSLEIVGQVEALLSLATLHRNHPDWCFPHVLNDTDSVFEATRLAHPLIDQSKVVANDYHNRDHQIALITGSNMAGKSTFLRTVGVNAILAWAGGPVFAQKMEISVMHLISYMRIKDSLAESTSTFKAELDRMKLILETVNKDKRSFFLIDEMLRGTNSVDKYLGSKAIIERLVQEGVSGMVATHDLQLSKLEETYPEIIRNFHFDIQIVQDEMKFDYLLKLGECKQFNASILLKGIGIVVTLEKD